MVNNIPVNGWPQLKDLEAVQPTLDRLDKIEDWKRTVKEETFTGDDITIENALALPARSLITSINAIQDLHGYDKPWAGGAYKQLIPMTVSGIKALTTTGTWDGNVYTISGVTITILTDNGNNVIGINVNGTATARIDFILGVVKLNGQYAISGSTNGSTTKWLVWVRGHGTDLGEISIDGAGYFSDYSEDNRDAILTVFADASPSNQKFYPMLCYRTATDPTTFAPYSNICPISGRTAAVITRSDGDEISEDFTIQLGQTVYGAEINWDTGVMTVKTAKIDLGSLDYLTATVGSVTFYYADVPNAPYRDYTAICSNYPVTNDETEFFANDGIARAYGTTSYGGFARVGIIDSRYNGYTTAQFKEAMSGVDYEYELATPTTIQLTPEQLEMLKGYNRITLSDGYGTIELKALTGANWS